MDYINTLEVDDFKDYFQREFNYLKIWNDKETYKINDVVKYLEDENFYISLVNKNINIIPTQEDKWELTGNTDFDFVLDEDISKAFIQAKGTYAFNLFSGENDDFLKMTFFLLVAHYLIIDLNMGKGNGYNQYFMNNKTVGKVSAGYTIPEYILKNPVYNRISKTVFGDKYLDYLIPRISCYGKTLIGTTTAF